MGAVRRGYFDSRGFRLSYLDSAPGARDRPAVLLLHGFPDEAGMWVAQIDALHAAGFRCIAPDTIGCGESAVGAQLHDYSARLIVADALALLDQLGIAQAHIVGHDWGAVLAWYAAIYYPQRVLRLVVLSVGHPTAYGRAGLAQKIKGWYVLFFLLAGLSERLLSGNGRFSLRRVFGTHPQMDAVMQRLSAPGRLTAALRIYRANFVDVLFRSHPAVPASTLALWSECDAFLTESQMLASESRVRGKWRYQRLGGRHWIPLEQPALLNDLLLAHLREA
ncbi:alpha/beta fold hydrolase [Solimonas terrae]|uniref:Alpha/beta hydrolase n=1 Tax=Solimonas terrae TaxID=1396819 RepID=A0A6M2BMX4_9GAMM|nr:alpha/beta hydrolase [Solimonas terrae]NGY03744.1 alpha/beta hydrolase [Solimonas terrae]